MARRGTFFFLFSEISESRANRGAIIESVCHVSFCKRGMFLVGILKKKWGMFFCGGKRKKRNIYLKKKIIIKIKIIINK